MQKKTWKIMKEIIGKTKNTNDSFPRKILINNTEIFKKEQIAKEFNKYFVNVGSNLAAKIPSSEKHFSEYIDKSGVILNEAHLSEKEFQIAFHSIKANKASGYDDINSTVIKSSYDQLFSPLFHICNISLKYGCFPDKMKIAKIKPLFKADENGNW